MGRPSQEKQDAHNSGQEDYKKCGGQVNSNPLTEFFHPSYKPSSDPELKEEYDKGWDNAKEQDSSKSGCYLTTACVNAMNLPDNYLELSVLRNFRDKILMPTLKGRKAVKEYYQIAPEIVQCVNEREDAQSIWQATYRDIRHAVSLVLFGDFEGAFKHYQQMTSKLRDKYLD